MHMLQAGVDLTVIALWLGHESTATTHMYVEADLAMKEVGAQCRASATYQIKALSSHPSRSSKASESKNYARLTTHRRTTPTPHYRALAAGLI